MNQASWLSLKEKLHALPKSGEPFHLTEHNIITDESKFLKTHIAVVDQYVRGNVSYRQKRFNFFAVKPHYDRLLFFYNKKIES